jgi:GH43 family beta-xylosidase
MVFENRVMREFENRVMRRLFGTKKAEVTWGWRKLRNGELSDLYFSPNIIWVIKQRRMK